jgi:hypothetical protein
VRDTTAHIMSDVLMELDDVDQAGNNTPPPSENKPSGRPKGKTATKATAERVRESGKSLLPLSRVQKIMKADKVCGSLHSTCKTSSLTLVLGVTDCCEGSCISHIIGNRGIYQEAIGG